MSLPTSYLITTKNLEAFFNAILNAQAPERFTIKFLENLEFKSTNDRLFIGVLKFLNFIDESGVPTERYFNFLDQSQSKTILADAIKDAYSDLFAINKNAQEMTVQDVKNKFKTLTQGQKTDTVINSMASTFKALCDYSDWSAKKTLSTQQETPHIPIEKNKIENTIAGPVPGYNKTIPSLNYNIQIHLPETRDSAVYDAIFKSLKDHLL